MVVTGPRKSRPASPARTADALELAVDAVKLYFQDGTERPIPRPTAPAVQETYYSRHYRE